MPSIQSAACAHLREAIDAIPAVSSHDHLRRESEMLAQPADLFDICFSGIVWADMVSAGLPVGPSDGIMGPSEHPRPRDYDAMWRNYSPWLDHVRECATFRAHWRGVAELHGIEEELNDSNWAEINDRIIASQKQGWYEEVLRRRGNMEAAMLDRPWTWAHTEPADRFYSCNVMRVMEWTDLPQDLRTSGGFRGRPMERLADAEAAFETHLEQLLHEGVIALKFGQAYWRTLDFEDVPRDDAARLFPSPDRPGHAPKPVQDYMANYVVRRAGEVGLPVAVHTGYQYGNGNLIENARAQLLAKMIWRNPKTRFDIFHISYPYCEEAMMLAKYFANAFFDFCFSDYLSPTKIVQLLHIGLELLPSNKMFAWGADAGLVECNHGSLCVTRDCVAQALAERVDAGLLTLPRAERLMRKLMRDNVAEMYDLAGWRAKHPVI